MLKNFMKGGWVSINPSKSQEVPPLDEGGCGEVQIKVCPTRGYRRVRTTAGVSLGPDPKVAG